MQMSNIYLETLNIEWSQTNLKDNRKVKTTLQLARNIHIEREKKSACNADTQKLAAVQATQRHKVVEVSNKSNAKP